MGALITKSNFSTSYHHTQGLNPGSSGTYYYICATSIIFQMRLNQPSSIFYVNPHVYMRIRQWNGSSWDTLFERTLRRGDSQRHGAYYHNAYAPGDSSVYQTITYDDKHLVEVFCRREQGEGEKCEWLLDAGGIGTMYETSNYTYQSKYYHNKIYGIGGNELYVISSSDLSASIVDTFSTRHKRGAQINLSNADFCTEKKIGE